MIPKTLCAALLAGALAGCGGGSPSSIGVNLTAGGQAIIPAAPAIPDPLDYLAPDVTPDQPVAAFRFDIGHYQASYAQRLPDGSAILDWSYVPFGPFVAANGDGGERYIVEGDTVRIDSTQDGGTPGVQYFTGAACGGTGWIAFLTNADSSWRALVARLGDRPDPSQCSTGSSAFTRYRRVMVTFPKLGALDTIISEHYSGADMASAPAMERSFFAKGYGRVAWQAWGKAGWTPPPPDLAARCPDFGWNSPPVAGLFLVDCREALDSEPAPAPLTGAQLWHP